MSISMHANGKAKHHFTTPEYYISATAGNIAFFEDLELEPSLLNQTSPRGDTVLHIAAQSGNDELIRVILTIQSGSALLESPNLTQNTPLHVAASAGHLSAVKVLLSAAQRGTIDDRAATKLLRSGNVEKNTALHLAMKSRHEDVARFLFMSDREVAHYVNCEGKSPLFMAAEAGYETLFKHMMESDEAAGIGRVCGACGDDGQVLLRHYRSKIVVATISAKNRGILALTLDTWPEVFQTTSDQTKTLHPIFHATSVGFQDGVRDILAKFRECSFFVNRDGQFPIHIASMKGNIKMIQEFLKDCPDSRELRNDQSQNILHLAAANGRPKTVSYMLKNPALQMLVNEKDCNGNTPLHLAAEGSHVKVVNILARNPEVHLEIINAGGLTALDVSEKYRGTLSSYSERLTWVALRHAGAPQSNQQLRQKVQMDRDFYKDRINTLMLVSTLIITITVAAGLVSPGSDSGSDNTNVLIALVEKVMLYPFVISNTVAMHCSIAVVLALVWAQFGDIHSFMSSLKYTLIVLAISLVMLSFAFDAGVYLTVRSHSTWLAVSVLIIGSICFFTLFSLIVPLFFKGCVARFLSYYSLFLLEKLTHHGDPEE